MARQAISNFTDSLGCILPKELRKHQNAIRAVDRAFFGNALGMDMCPI